MPIKWVSYLLFLFFFCVSSPMTLEKLPERSKIPVKRANFKVVLDYVLQREGYYAFVKHDQGGETYMGISRTYTPNFTGWKVIDEYKRHNIIKWNDSIPGLKWYVKLHYVDLFVDNKFFDIQDQDIANQCFDAFINSNYRGIMLINQTLKDMGYNIPVIGEMTDSTIIALNSTNKWEFLTHFTSKRAQYYSKLVIDKPSQLVFLSNWMSRTKIR